MGVLIVAAFVPSAGAALRGGDSAEQDGDTIVIGMPDWNRIDPALLTDPTSVLGSAVPQWAVTDATCATLLRYPVGAPMKQDYRLVPEVAASYPVVSRDGKTYTFTVRSGYRFSTGVPVRAANYKRAFDRVLDPAMDSPAAKYLQEVTDVRVAGNRLIVRLSTRVPDFPARMTMPYLCPVPRDLPIIPEGAPAPLPGSGPYYIAEFVREKRVVLKRNTFYRGPRAHHVDGFVVELGDDAVTWSGKVEAGTADVDLGVPVPVLPELGKKYPVNKSRLFAVPAPNLFYLYMNTERPLFRGNVKLRQAVNFAIDRPKMVLGLGAPWAGAVTDDYLPPGSPGYLDAHLYALKHPDLKKAKALADGNTRSGKAVMYTCDNIITGCRMDAQTVRDNLKAIGIDVEIKAFPNAVFDEKTRTRGEPFDLAYDRLLAPWVDPFQYVDLLVDGRRIQEKANTNRSFFNSDHYNRLIDEAWRLSGGARYAFYGKLAVDLAKNAAPMAATYARNRRFFVSSRVGCVRVSAHGLDLAGLCLLR